MAKKTAASKPRGRWTIPAHILELMVALAQPEPGDTVCDPFCADGDLLAAAAEYVRTQRRLHTAQEQCHYRSRMFHGFDADRAALQAARARLTLSEIETRNLHQRDSLKQAQGEDDAGYSLILGRAPLGTTGSIKAVAADLLELVRSTRSELLALARCMRLLERQGRAVVLLPEAALSAATEAHRALRSALVRNFELEAVVRLPRGMLAPQTDAALAVVVFARGENATTREVWFYDVSADGFSLDAARSALLPADQLGAAPQRSLEDEHHQRNNLPDLLRRWRAIRAGGADAAAAEERKRPRSAQSFFVTRADIDATDCSLGIERYQRFSASRTEPRPAHQILAELAGLEAEIFQGMKDIVGMLK